MFDAASDAAPPRQPLLPLPDLGVQMAPRASSRRRPRARAPRMPEIVPGPAVPPSPPPVDLPSADAAQLRARRRVYLGLASRWALSGHEALVLLGEPLDGEAERCERLRLLVGVTRVLQVLHPEPARACAFLRNAHPDFVGTAPLQLMLTEGQVGIGRVMTHLVAQARW